METFEKLDSDPFHEFQKLYQKAVETQTKYPDAMSLATSTRSGTPSVRVVLFKGLNSKGFRFFTNYRSRKGKELGANPKAAAVFYWPGLDRQIRIEGKIEKLSKKESDEYWLSRARESRLSALVSPQSTAIPDKKKLETSLKELTLKYEGKDIPRPSHWGGYCLIPERIEFWQEGGFRFHDRFCYLKKKGKWVITRLAP